MSQVLRGPRLGPRLSPKRMAWKEIGRVNDLTAASRNQKALLAPPSPVPAGEIGVAQAIPPLHQSVGHWPPPTRQQASKAKQTKARPGKTSKDLLGVSSELQNIPGVPALRVDANQQPLAEPCPS